MTVGWEDERSADVFGTKVEEVDIWGGEDSFVCNQPWYQDDDDDDDDAGNDNDNDNPEHNNSRGRSKKKKSVGNADEALKIAKDERRKNRSSSRGNQHRPRSGSRKPSSSSTSDQKEKRRAAKGTSKSSGSISISDEPGTPKRDKEKSSKSKSKSSSSKPSNRSSSKSKSSKSKSSSSKGEEKTKQQLGKYLDDEADQFQICETSSTTSPTEHSDDYNSHRRAAESDSRSHSPATEKPRLTMTPKTARTPVIASSSPRRGSMGAAPDLHSSSLPPHTDRMELSSHGRRRGSSSGATSDNFRSASPSPSDRLAVSGHGYNRRRGSAAAGSGSSTDFFNSHHGVLSTPSSVRSEPRRRVLGGGRVGLNVPPLSRRHDGTAYTKRRDSIAESDTRKASVRDSLFKFIDDEEPGGQSAGKLSGFLDASNRSKSIQSLSSDNKSLGAQSAPSALGRSAGRRAPLESSIRDTPRSGKSRRWTQKMASSSSSRAAPSPRTESKGKVPISSISQEGYIEVVDGKMRLVFELDS